MNLKLNIKEMISKVLDELNFFYDEKDVVIEVPKLKQNGDFSCGIAMKISKKLKDLLI